MGWNGALGRGITDAVPERPKRKTRLKEPVREQVVLRYELPEATLPPSHAARVLWRVLETLELYGISRGVGSALEIARRVREDRAFEWIAGGVTVSHDVLRNFRIEHGDALDRLMSRATTTTDSKR